MERMIQGKIIGNYQITGELGNGAMGTVYRGHHRSLPREVVIKSIRFADHDPRAYEHLRKRFLREAFVQSQLDHPNIVRVYEFFNAADNDYMVMEFVDGMSLEKLLERQGVLAPPQALRIFRQVLAALDYAHNFSYVDEAGARHTGIVHRDIKPANIMLDGQARAKLTDFGIVQVGGEHKMTQTGFQPGTVAYMSPEQLQGFPLDRRSDIYSLGVTLYEMLAGRLPFVASTTSSDYEIRKGHIELEPPPIHQINPAVPARLADVVARALEKRPEARYQTAQEFLSVIGAYESAADTATPFVPNPMTGMTHEPGMQSTDAQAKAHATSDTTNPSVVQSPRVVNDATNRAVPADSSPIITANPPRQRNTLLIAGAVFCLLLVGATLAYRSWSAGQAVSNPPDASTPAASPSAVPARVEAMKYYLQVITANGVRLNGETQPLLAGESFKFHFTPRAGGYLYIIAPNEKNAPMSFLTAKPLEKTGVKTNHLEADTDFEFPAGSGNWIGVTRDTFATPFTVIFSQTPLTMPAFLAAEAGKNLSLADQHELEEFRKQFSAKTAATKV